MILYPFRVSRLMIALILLGFQLTLAGCSASSTVNRVRAASLPATQTNAVENRPMRFQRISIDEGLSESAVDDILQDRQGYLWFATQDGLNRYDGFEFTVFRHDPLQPNTLSHSHITNLIEDSQGDLWIGTSNAGINRYNPTTNTFTRFLPDPDDPTTILEGRVIDIVEDHQGQIWIGVFGGGISRYDPAAGIFHNYSSVGGDSESLKNNEVLSLAETPDGIIWAATPAGLDRLDPSSGKFTHFAHQDNQSNGLSSSSLCKLFVDQQGRLWIGTHDNGLDLFDPLSGQFTHYAADPKLPGMLPNKDIGAIAQDTSGIIWVGMGGGGLCRLDENAQKFSCYFHDPTDPYSLSPGDVVSIYEDRSGILWIGTFGGGISRLDPNLKPFQLLRNDPKNPNSPGGNMVFAVYAEPDRTIWIGTDDAGLDRVDRSTGKVTHYRHDPSDPTTISSDKVRALYVDPSGNVWIGTTDGLDILDPRSGGVTHVTSGPEDKPISVGYGVTNILPGTQDDLWVSLLGTGMLRLKLGAGGAVIGLKQYYHMQEDPTTLAENIIYSLAIEPDGTVWAGTINSGLERFDPTTETFTHYPADPANPSALSDSTVISLLIDSTGTLWVGTSGGLNRMDRENGSFRRYRVEDGLPNDVIYAIEEDTEGHLWLSTNKGLSRFDPVKETFKNFDVQDGLQSNEFNAGASFRAPDGELFFGGINGLSTFYPQQIQDNPYIPPVVLTSLSQHGEPVALGQEVTLRYPNNSFDFEFAALNYIRPEKNQHAYRLEGFENDWNAIGGGRSGRYTNLPGGTFTLRLKASNNDGLWNETGASVRIRVIPPFWQTWMFRGAALALAVSVVAAGVRLRTRSILSRNEALERLVRARAAEIERLYEQTKELAVIEERNRLARDLHDSAKQKAFAALAQLGAANGLVKNNPLRALPALKEAETLVYEVIEDLTFLIQEMYPVALKEKGLAAVLREHVFEWESRNEICVDLQITGERALPLQVEQALYRISQEALANVARHAHASRVQVVVEYGQDMVRLEIADNGQGFDLGNRPSGVGMRSMQERISMIGGKLTIESAPGKGARISACVPLPVSEVTA